MQEEYKKMWEDCVKFHGHSCGGLAVGFRAGLYAMELLECGRAEDEEIVCIAETDACGVDAIQVLLGCTLGKGNLILDMQGKNAFTFFNRENGKSTRLVLRRTPEKTKEERLEWLMSGDYREMFDVKAASIPVPERARIFESYVCECCGETTGAAWIRIFEGRKLCMDCLETYDRFNV